MKCRHRLWPRAGGAPADNACGRPARRARSTAGRTTNTAHVHTHPTKPADATTDATAPNRQRRAGPGVARQKPGRGAGVFRARRHAGVAFDPDMDWFQGKRYPQTRRASQVPSGKSTKSASFQLVGPSFIRTLPCRGGFRRLGATWCDVELSEGGCAAHITRCVAAPPFQMPGAAEDPAAELLRRPTSDGAARQHDDVCPR